MKQIAAAAALAITLGGCSVYREATSARIDASANWRQVAIPELPIIFYMTGLMTAFSGLHYLVRGLRQWHFQ